MAKLSQNTQTPKNGVFSFFSNPFDAAHTAVKSAGADFDNSRLAAAAADIFADKPYDKEYSSVYVLTRILSAAAGAVSFFTALFALQFLLSYIVGNVVSWGGAVLFCGVLEFLKFLLWKRVVKTRLRYKKTAIGGLTVLFFLHLLSLATSLLGAFLIPSNGAAAVASEGANTAARYHSQIAQVDGQMGEIDKQITAFLPHVTAPNGKKSSSTAAQIAALRTQKDALLAQKKELAAGAETAAAADAHAAAAVAVDTASKLYTTQILCVILALVFELVYIACALFGFYYLFRAFIDYVADGQSAPIADGEKIAVAQLATAGKDSAQRVFQDGQSPNSEPRKIGFFSEQNSCATVAQPPKQPKQPENSPITPQTPFIITESNGVPVASVLGKLYTVDRVRSNYTANKSKAPKGKIYADKAAFWERVLLQLQTKV
jgi:hypothetical protein